MSYTTGRESAEVCYERPKKRKAILMEKTPQKVY